MIPQPLLPGVGLDPQPTPVTPALTRTITPPADTSFNHVTGELTGDQLQYGDLWSFAWYVPQEVTEPPQNQRGNWSYRNSRRLGRDGLTDISDTNRRQM